VRGAAGAGLDGGHDVIIAVDRSASVFAPSGSDLDRDGQIGRSRKNIDLFVDYQQACTDPGDTILAGELQAAKLLIESFDPRATRMGLLSFGVGARVHAPLGSSRGRLLSALDALPQQAEFGGTSFQSAFRLAHKQFDGISGSASRTRTIILLSDGQPSYPTPIEHARRFAVQAAEDLARHGVRVFAFAMGPDAVADPSVYRRITRVTGGALYLVDSPSQITAFAPHVPLHAIERIEIDNLSASRPARAVRLGPDGAFDGFAPLVPGLNLLRVTAVGDKGEVRTVERRVYFEQTAADAAETERTQEILRALQLRTLEAQMANATRRRLREGRRVAISVGE
jgi:hypothetical protein